MVENTLIKESRVKEGSIEYYVKMFADNENGRYSIYANNSNFNWGHTAIFNTKEEAEEDYNKTIHLYNKKWKEVKYGNEKYNFNSSK